MKKYTLTPEHREQLKPWAEKWIANAMATRPMTEADKEASRVAALGLYAAAGLPPPKHIVFVSSPFVLRFSGGFAAAIWYLKKNKQPTYAATDAATRAATDDATHDATDAATDAATYAATDNATDAATYDATRYATRAATDDATRAATHDATDAATYAATYAATDDATDNATYAATDDATYDATYAATDNATYAATDDATRAATYAATRDATHDATRDATRAATHDATHDATDAATRDATRAATHAAKPSPRIETWYSCGNPANTDAALKLNGFGIKCAVGAWRMWQGGNQWSAWAGFLSFFRHVVKLPLDYSKWSHWEALAECSGPRIMHPDFCMISDRPSVLLVDEQNRPHCDTGPFCQWRDGSALYAVHGVRIPAYIITSPELITVADIDAEQNAEVRRVMIDRYKGGQVDYIKDSGAEKIQEDDYGTLYRKELPGDEPVMMVNVINSTPEPDGSFKPYWIRVPPTIATAREAVAWSFGLKAEEYEPAIET